MLSCLLGFGPPKWKGKVMCLLFLFKFIHVLFDLGGFQFEFGYFVWGLPSFLSDSYSWLNWVRIFAPSLFIGKSLFSSAEQNIVLFCKFCHWGLSSIMKKQHISLAVSHFMDVTGIWKACFSPCCQNLGLWFHGEVVSIRSCLLKAWEI